MRPNDWDHWFRPRVRNRPITVNRPIPAVHRLDVLKWAIFFILVTAVLLYVMAAN